MAEAASEQQDQWWELGFLCQREELSQAAEVEEEAPGALKRSLQTSVFSRSDSPNPCDVWTF